MDDTNTPYLEAAMEAARLGGRVLEDYAGRAGTIAIDMKGLNDYVTEVDHASEKAILAFLTALFPEHSIVAEESPEQNRDRRYQWFIDPLDGTTNYIHGVPCYAVSVGLAIDGRLAVG